MSLPERPNPFPGLRPFRSDEHHLFFGREEQTAALLQLLRTNRFLAVVGTSGSGKSSLVRAGMIAELHGGTMTQAGSTWEVMILRPGGSPIENLARAFVDADLYDASEPSTLPRLLATLNRSRFGLVEAMKQSELFEPGVNLLVVVDQFEELFRFRQQNVDSEETAAAFVNLLLAASEQTECPIYVAITMRSDYLGDCSEIPGLAEAVNEGEYLIPRLLRDQKRDAIEKPIGVGGAKIAPLLVQRLLNEVGDDPDQLPVLQHALMRMWDVWSKESDHHRPIDVGDFEATGGLGAALSNHADEIYDALPDDRHRFACEKIFKSLTVKGDDNRGIRRPTRLSQLTAIASTDGETVKEVLDDFRSAGVTFLMPGTEVDLTDRTVLDLSHESLMRGWRRLRSWVEEEAQSARVFRRLLDTARLWSDGKAGLFRDPDLQIALSWRDEEHPNAEWADQYGGHFETAIQFLDTSNAEEAAERLAKETARQRELAQAQELAESRKQRLLEQQREAGRLRTLIVGLAVVALIAGAACVMALASRNEAGRLAKVAAQEADNARQNEAKAKQSQQETKDALATVETQKKDVEGSLSKAEAAERVARGAEEAGRKLLYTTDMRLAPFVWRDDRSTADQLRALLAKHIPDGKSHLEKPDLRGFEWYYYQHLLEKSAAVFSGHDAPIASGAFTSNDQLATLDANGQARRWDLSLQREVDASRRDLPAGLGAQYRVLSPDGRLAAFAEQDKVRVFDTLTGRATSTIDSANRSSRRLIFCRNSDMFVVIDDKIRWCNAGSGAVIASVDQKFDRVEALACSADGLTLGVVGYGDLGNRAATFRLDPTAKKATRLAKDFGGGGTLNAAALNLDGSRIAVGGKLGGFVFVYDAVTGRSLASRSAAHASPIGALAYSSDGALASADTEGTIKIWAAGENLNSKSVALRTLKGHQGAINGLGFSVDGKRLVSASADKTARVWDLENTGAAGVRLESASTSTTFATRFSPDGQLIAVASGGPGVGLWDAATGRLVRGLAAEDGSEAVSVAFSPIDRRLLAVGYGGEKDVSHIVLWDIDLGTELARLPGATDLPDFQLNEQTGPVGALAFSPNGKYLVAGFGSKTMLSPKGPRHPLKVWDVGSRRLIRRLEGHTGFCVSLAFSKDGALLASGSRDGTAIIWSTATWKPAKTLKMTVLGDSRAPYAYLREMVENVAFSPDGKTLAMAGRDGSVRLWGVADGALAATLVGHSSAVEAVAFSPDGRTLASSSVDQTVRLWNVETGRELMQLDAGGIHLGQVDALAFSPDGKQLSAGGKDVFCWAAAPRTWNDPAQSAEKLRLVLQSNADFQSRIRMFSENLRIHEGLEKLDAKDKRVQAASAATQANWHASRQAWLEAAAAFDRLKAADPVAFDGWLRTPGLLRVATALLHQDRPRDAAALLTGGAKRREQDGLAAAVAQVGVGLSLETKDGATKVKELMNGSPATRSRLAKGDTLLKVDETSLAGKSALKVGSLLAGELVSKVRLTVRHAGSDKSEVIELTRERYIHDVATGELLRPLQSAVNQRLAKAPRDPGLLELRAELAGQWSDAKAQAADYTAAIDALSQQKGETAAADLKRLYKRRGNVYVALKQWRQAVEDFARVISEQTTDDALLASEALARAEALLESAQWAILKPVEATSKLGATLSILPDSSILAGGSNRLDDRYRVVLTVAADIKLAAVRLEALTHDSLPQKGPGRHPTGNYAQWSWKVAATLPGSKDPVSIEFDKTWADQQFQYTPQPNGHFNIFGGGEGRDCTAIWALSKPIFLPLGSRLTFEFQFKSAEENSENLGHFRLAASSNPAAIDVHRKRFLAEKLTDPWQKLAAAYRLQNNQLAIDQLVARRPKSGGLIGDLFIQGTEEEKDWPRALSLYSKGIAGKTPDVDLLAKRARAYEGLKNWEAAAADWSRAAAGNPDGAGLIGDFARRLAGSKVPAASKQFEQAQGLYEQALKENPGNDVVAADLAQLLLDKFGLTEPEWVVLKPVEAKTESGTKLTLEDDGSIRLEEAPDKQQTVRWQPGPQPMQAIRIETGAAAQAPISGGRPVYSEYQALAINMARPGTLQGQFVRLDLPGDNNQFPRWPGDGPGRSINLAELQVFQGDKNIALRKKARQSSDLNSSNGAEKAVDGNTDQSSLAHTWYLLDRNNAWWEVDLGAQQRIDRIVVWNRPDVNLYPRMNHFRIRVLDHARNVVFEQVIDKAPSPTTEIIPQALLGDTKADAAGPLVLRLPRIKGNEAPPRYRASVAMRLADAGIEDDRLEVMSVSDVDARLAAAYAMNGQNEAALPHFNTALERAKDFEPRKAVTELAARFPDVLAALCKQQPDDPHLQLALARNLTAKGRRLLADKQPGNAQAKLEKAREILSRRRAKSPWTLLRPTEMTSTGGESFTLEQDGSVFVGGPTPDRSIYTLKMQTDLPTVTALLLETIPDARLPDGGAGRFGNGNFHVAELTAAFLSGKQGGGTTAIEFSSATADEGKVETGNQPESIIDGDPRTRWDIHPHMAQPHWVILALKTPLRIDGGRLSITLDSGISQWGQHGLGRFRLSATNEGDLLAQTRLWKAFNDNDVVNLNIALAIAHFQQDREGEAVASFGSALDLAADRAAKAKIIAEAAPLDGVLKKLAEREMGNAPFQVELARHFAERGDAALASAARAKALPLLERRLALEPDNVDVASDLANLLWSGLPPADYYWIDDAGPPGAKLLGDTPWEFVGRPDHPVFKGAKSSRRQAKGVSQHFLDEASPGLMLSEGAKLFSYVYLDPKDPPKAVMLQFKALDWDHRAYWGEDVIAFGTVGKVDHVSMGPLPKAGEWVRLEVDAAKVGLSAGAIVTGWAFTQFGGTCYWDAAGTTASIQEPWQKLAAAYHRLGDRKAFDALVERRPEAAGGVGDLSLAAHEWERAVTEYGKLIAARPGDVALATKLALAYQRAGRTREAIPHLGRASEANPKDTLLSLKVAALQAWFGQEKELAATRQRLLAFAKDTKEAMTAERVAKACSISPSFDRKEFEAALALARESMKLGKVGESGEWGQLALGMAEYRSGNFAAADEALRAAAQAGPSNPHVSHTASCYRAMALARQGKKEEARKLLISVAVKMAPLPADDQNPLAKIAPTPGGGENQENLIQWLAFKEARTLLKLDLSPIQLLEEAHNDEATTLGADNPGTVATTLKLVDAYVAAGRTRETVRLLTSASAASPKDTILAMRAAAMLAWFGQKKDLDATRKQVLAYAKDSTDPGTCEQAAKTCSFLPMTDKADLETALTLARRGSKLRGSGQWAEWSYLALGMAEYRSGNFAAADEALRAAVKAAPDAPLVNGIAGFYRAMSLFRKGKQDEARKLAVATAAAMTPPPADEQNPLTDGAFYETQFLWLAYKEAKAMIKFDPVPPKSPENANK